MAPPLNLVEAALRQARDALGGLGARWALVGGLAVGARAEPRTTRDVDLAVDVSNDAGAEAIVFALQGLGYTVGAVVEQKGVGRLATARLFSDAHTGVVLDLLFASCGVEPEIAAAAELLDIVPGLTVPLARTGHLLAMKVLARDDRRRPQDADDLRHLLEVADATEVERARSALRLIDERGFSRGRDLLALFDAAIHDR